MATKEIHLAQLIWQTRRLFQRVSNESNDLLNTFGITASQRAVLQLLDHDDAETLSNMARAQEVSRQHIQQTVNELLEKDLVETIANPKHKRSFLVRHSKVGDKLFLQIKKAESALFKEMASEFKLDALKTSINTLTQMNTHLQSENWIKTKNKVLSRHKGKSK